MRTFYPGARLLISLLLLLLAAAPVHADFNAAVSAYDRGDFAAAADGFERLARLGNPRAQYNLGLMLVQGQGRPRDLQGAYDWLEAARGNGDVEGASTLAQLRALQSLDVAAAATHAARYRAIAGTDLGAPALFASSDGGFDVAAARRIDVVFPDRAVAKGQLAVVWSLVVIGADGLAADAWTLYSVPRDEFDETLEEAFKRGRFRPAVMGDAPVPSVSLLQSRFGYRASVAGDLTQHAPAVKWVRETRLRAEAGDVGNQALLGIVLSGYPELAEDPGEPQRRLESASRGGAVDATFLLGILHVFNARSPDDWAHGMSYLLRAGRAGHSEAQLLVALELARNPDVSAQARAIDWLDAAAHTNPRAALYLCAELLLSPHETLRDVSRARRLMLPLLSGSDERRNPLLWEVAAALSGIDGRMAEAVERQTRAVRLRGEAPGRGDSLAQQRLRAYAEGRAWNGRLLPLAQRYASLELGKGRACAEEAQAGSRIPRCE